MLDQRAWALLRRLTRWLEQFKDCFGHRAQRVSLRQYVDGLIGDSARKSMQAMLARVTEPTSYQAFQHFITDAPWDADTMWRRLREVLPVRRGILVFDETSFPKQGPHSVGVARQYLWRARQSRQLPSGGDGGLVGRAAGVAARSPAVFAGRVDDGRGATEEGPRPGDESPAREMAPRV